MIYDGRKFKMVSLQKLLGVVAEINNFSEIIFKIYLPYNLTVPDGTAS